MSDQRADWLLFFHLGLLDQQIGQLYELMRTIRKQGEGGGEDPLS